MAIDDNTVYGLTGAQVKELPGKIEAVKGLARELTADDYNYPTSNPTGVAQWLLPEGIYSCDSTTNIYADNSASPFNSPLFFKSTQGNYSWMIYFDVGEKRWRYWGAHKDTGDRYVYGAITPAVIDNLTSTSTTGALSANQGRMLKDLIDAIVVPTKTSDLTNDSNFVTATEMDTALADKADANDIPTALSELTNDINAVSDANYVHTDNNYTTPEKTKLAGIAAGAEANVQPNWAETDTAADSYIQNKPTIPTAVSQLTNDAGYTTNTGTITGVSVNGTSVATSGVADIPSATTSRYGVTQLSTSTSSTSTTTAATPSAVRTAYNLANGKATIAMTDTDPGEGGTLGANQFIAVYGGSNPDSYSTTEIDTGATWIDGNAIYKKTIQISSLPNAAETGYPHGISNLSTVVRIEGIRRSGSRASDLSAPGINSAQDGIQLSVDATNIYVNVGTDRQSNSADVTLYYTKQTASSN